MLEYLLNTISTDIRTSSGMYHRYCLPWVNKETQFYFAFRISWGTRVQITAHICHTSQNAMGLYNTSTNITC